MEGPFWGKMLAHQLLCYSSALFTTPGPVAQSDARPSGIQEFAGSISPVRQHSFAEIDHEISSKAILSLPLVVSYWWKDVH